MTAIAATIFTIPRLSRRARAAVLTIHVAMSVGWLGLDGALVALEVAGLSTANAAMRAGIGAAMAVIACWVLIPVVFASLTSGLVLALSTPWGLGRYWWVLAKCGIAGALYVPQVGIINPSEMSPGNSIEMVIWTAVGGRGSLVGPIIGAFSVNGLKSWFTGAFPDLWLYALGLMFILVTLFMPQGMLGLAEKLQKTRRPHE